MVEMIKFLTSCALVEDAAARIYSEMATAASAVNNEELRDIWLEMAKDEEDHAHQLRMAARLSRESVFVGAASIGDIDPGALITRAGSLLDQIVAGQLSDLDMLRLAQQLEGDFNSLHATAALAFKDESMKKMFKALAREDSKHVARLKAKLAELAASSKA